MSLIWFCYYLDPGALRETGAHRTSSGPSAAQGPQYDPGNKGMDHGTNGGKDLVPTFISAFLNPVTAQLSPQPRGLSKLGLLRVMSVKGLRGL